MSSNDITLTGRLTPYVMNNLSLEKGFAFRRADLSLKATINNLFNEEYLSVLSRPMPRMNCEFFINVKPKWGKEKPNREMIRPLRRFTLCAAALLLAACGARPGTSLEEFRTTIYRPAYAAGFEIVGAEGLQKHDPTDPDPVAGAAEGTATALFIARNGETPPAGFDGQTVEAGGRSASSACPRPTWRCSTPWGRTAHRRRIGPGEHRQRIRRRAPRQGRRRGLRRQRELRTASVAAPRPGAAVRRERRQPDGTQGCASWASRSAISGGSIWRSRRSARPNGSWPWRRRSTGARRANGRSPPIPERYEALKAKVAESAARPKVMINAPYGDSWFMASAESYVARLIADAGGDYIYRENTSNRSLPIDLEKAYLLASGADVWINAGSFRTLAEFRARLPKFAGVPCVRRGEIYNCDRRTNAAGGNDYWESGVVRPDVVLHDLIAVFHPEALDAADREMHYYRKLE